MIPVFFIYFQASSNHRLSGQPKEAKICSEQAWLCSVGCLSPGSEVAKLSLNVPESKKVVIDHIFFKTAFKNKYKKIETESKGIQNANNYWGGIDTDLVSLPKKEIKIMKNVQKEKEVAVFDQVEQQNKDMFASKSSENVQIVKKTSQSKAANPTKDNKDIKFTKSKAVEPSKLNKEVKVTKSKAVQRVKANREVKTTKSKAVEPSNVIKEVKFTKSKAVEPSKVNKEVKVTKPMAVQPSKVDKEIKFTKSKAVDSKLNKEVKVTKPKAVQPAKVDKEVKMTKSKTVEPFNVNKKVKVTKSAFLPEKEIQTMKNVSREKDLCIFDQVEKNNQAMFATKSSENVRILKKTSRSKAANPTKENKEVNVTKSNDILVNKDKGTLKEVQVVGFVYSNIPKIVKPSVNVEKLYKCLECSGSFKERLHLLKHSIMKHSRKVNVKSGQRSMNAAACFDNGTLEPSQSTALPKKCSTSFFSVEQETS